jgi:phosphatidylserine/phosphatidylglycerophosphate/cardiolipin synthase-like enzyme
VSDMAGQVADRLGEQVVLAIEKRRGAIIDVIRSARKRLLISLFRCTDFPILDAIAEVRQRNVEVKLLLTPRARGWEKRLKELQAYLESMGVLVHPYSDPVVKYHAKYLVADDGPALVGSLNMTAKCFGATCDFILVTHEPEVVSGLQKLFEADWLAPHSTFPAGISGRLIIGPDRARAQFTALLEGARRSIHLIDHKMSDLSIQALLRSKKDSGVDVEILAASRLGGLLPHGKLVIVDGKSAAFGSMSLSALSLDFRREVAVIVDDARCVRKLKDFYRFVARGGEIMDPARAREFVREEMD